MILICFGICLVALPAIAVFVVLIEISKLIHSRLERDGNWRAYGDMMRRYSHGKWEYRDMTNYEKNADLIPDAW